MPRRHEEMIRSSFGWTDEELDERRVISNLWAAADLLGSLLDQVDPRLRDDTLVALDAVADVIEGQLELYE